MASEYLTVNLFCNWVSFFNPTYHYLDPCGWPCKVIWGAGELSSWALKQLIKHIFQSSTHDHGGGKNSQHGKSEDRPSDLRRLEELEKAKETATGKDKVKIQNKINNLKKEMAARKKGENHSQKPKK
jgi:hypothetical protein